VAQLIEGPTRIPVPGGSAEETEPRGTSGEGVSAARGKVIEEYVGRVNSGESAVSVAHMNAPGGWVEPAQRPDFDEVTLVLRGCVRVEHDGGVIDVRAGQAAVTRAGERVRYTTPEEGGAEYVAICLPAFSPDTAHRDPD
jgi:mannose-6-phosphate isomerase-like protein (cupin superfamily)